MEHAFDQTRSIFFSLFPSFTRSSLRPDNRSKKLASHFSACLLVARCVSRGRLDEQQRRWYVAMESDRIGPGGDEVLSQITGMNPKTIQRGRQELASGLVDRPHEQVRVSGGGRQRAEKKMHH